MPNALSTDARRLIREAALETGFLKRKPVLDEKGRPTGNFVETVVWPTIPR